MVLTQEDGPPIVFTDEKDYSLAIAKNRQNYCAYGPSKKADRAPSKLYHEPSRFSKKIVVTAGVSGQGKTNIHFIDSQRAKFNSETNTNLLLKYSLTDCRILYTQNNYIFQQDGASSHTNRASPDYLTENTN